MDWKKKIDEHYEKESRKLQQKEEKRKAAEDLSIETRRQRRQEQWHAEYAKRLAKLQSKFRCHICGQPASKPSTKDETTNRLVDRHEFYSGPKEYQTITVDDWSTPGDLIKCNVCKKWTHVEHMHRGICERCGERL